MSPEPEAERIRCLNAERDLWFNAADELERLADAFLTSGDGWMAVRLFEASTAVRSKAKENQFNDGLRAVVSAVTRRAGRG